MKVDVPKCTDQCDGVQVESGVLESLKFMGIRNRLTGRNGTVPTINQSKIHRGLNKKDEMFLLNVSLQAIVNKKSDYISVK